MIYALAFNSLSRDHFSAASETLLLRPLSTPSLGITLRGPKSSRLTSRTFNSLSRDHEIAGEIEERVASYIFQLPLSGSHAGPRQIQVDKAIEIFQLPLSGSLESLISDIVGIGLLCLSTPSLGITAIEAPSRAKTKRYSFQLPLSGSQNVSEFPPLRIILRCFQLPLSGSQ